MLFFFAWSAFSQNQSLPVCNGSPLEGYPGWSDPSKNWDNCIGEKVYNSRRDCSWMSAEQRKLYTCHKVYYKGGWKKFKKDRHITDLSGYYSTYHGFGVATSFDNPNDIYIGMWRKGSQSGEGYRVKNGKVEDGLWERNKLVKAYTTKYAPKPVPLRDQFKKLTQKNRKAVQKVLKNLYYYKSKVDGLYGKNTKSALQGFNRGKLGGLDLEKETNVKKLFSAILELAPKEKSVQPKIETAEKPKSTEKKKEAPIEKQPKKEIPKKAEEINI